jgi:phage-related tail fiber protein
MTETKAKARSKQAEETVRAQAPAQAETPIGVAYGGEGTTATEPVVQDDLVAAREEDPRNVAGLAYGKHSSEASDEEGNVTPIVVAHPVRVDGRNKRSDDDVPEGARCTIVQGNDKNTDGVFFSVERYDPQSGYPVQVIVRTDDDQNQFLSLPYSYIRPRKSLR